MRKLIFGTSYVATPERMELTEMWYRMNRHANPDCDLMLVDTPTPEQIISYTPCIHNAHYKIIPEDMTPVRIEPGLNWVQFQDNIGHLSHTGKDGWSRAFTYGLHCALANGYDYVAHVEGDLLSRIKFDDAIAIMDKHNLGAVSTLAARGNYMEIGLVFMKTDYLLEIDFLGKYNWQGGTKDVNGQRPEDMVAEAMRGRFLYEYWPGGRDELDDRGGLFKDEDMKRIYFITHAWHHRYYHEFMRQHAPEINWQPLLPDDFGKAPE